VTATAVLVAAFAATDKLLVTLAVIAFVGVVHAVAYTSAQGALRPQRILLCRGADLLAITAALFLIRMWTRS
jgi:hypothetical protein